MSSLISKDNALVALELCFAVIGFFHTVSVVCQAIFKGLKHRKERASRVQKKTALQAAGRMRWFR